MLTYRDIKFKDISLIKSAWERNRQYHEEISTHFGETYQDLIFEDRISGFNAIDADNLKVTIAEEASSQTIFGYCLSSIHDDTGEVHSLHVLTEARQRGIGKQLMQLHLDWFHQKNCKHISLTVSYENHATIKFYESLGFKPNLMEMRLKKDSN